MSPISICHCEKTFSSLTCLGGALFKNFALYFRYFASLFVIPRMFRSLSPEKLWAGLECFTYNSPNIGLFKHVGHDRKRTYE